MEAEVIESRIVDQVKIILLREWDPIGIRDVPQARDEYDAYVGSVVKLILAGESARDIANLLMKIETDQLGLPADEARSVRVARLLHHLRGDDDTLGRSGSE
jgi:hypothetical protein